MFYCSSSYTIQLCPQWLETVYSVRMLKAVEFKFSGGDRISVTHFVGSYGKGGSGLYCLQYYGTGNSKDPEIQALGVYLPEKRLEDLSLILLPVQHTIRHCGE